eukprot:2729515-Amphidinium_carterae.1
MRGFDSREAWIEVKSVARQRVAICQLPVRSHKECLRWAGCVWVDRFGQKGLCCNPVQFSGNRSLTNVIFHWDPIRQKVMMMPKQSWGMQSTGRQWHLRRTNIFST